MTMQGHNHFHNCASNDIDTQYFFLMMLFILTGSPPGGINVHPRDEEGFPLTAYDNLLKAVWKQPDL